MCMTSRAPPASRAVVVWFIPARSARCSSSLHYCVGVPPSLRFVSAGDMINL
ncbi:hypothetical protein PF010_g1723 [Phytophthora fragariae]|uniref:Uncharacterized protein n=1 Tax=Phytophthora fragariae TaxID=53985 RepID=A0A6G0LZ61_9STRA|nr:hypothetical protein PF010_g1723 [Phytophthora fragariae]